MSGIVGDFAALRQLSVRVRTIGQPEFSREMGVALGATAMNQLVRGFQGQRNPYGAAWAGLKMRRGQILRDTGRLWNSFSTAPTGHGFRLGTNVIYASAHQYGLHRPSRARAGKRAGVTVGYNLPQRQMVPEMSTGGLGLWGDAFNRDANRLVREQVGK